MRHYHRVHFIGIGGAGMSGIAEVLLNLGYHVSGSDLKASDATRRLARLGAEIFIGHRARQVQPGTDLVVVSNAVPDTNPEVLAARDREIPVFSRARMLNDLMRLKQGLAIAGTHGKTTTTSMLAWIMAQAGMDPTLVIGGVLNNIHRNARKGKGEYFVVEACEAYSSFLQLNPVAVIVTNIDDDHLENYGSRGALDDAFVEFVNRVPFWGFAVLNGDDPGVKAIAPRIVPRTITYGFSAEADVQAASPVQTGLRQDVLVTYHGRVLGHLRIGLPGRFNLANALAATAMALELGVPFKTVQRALTTFRGVRRRFEFKGRLNRALVVDDYGHHPTEVAATLTAARTLNPGRLLVLFQPHLFSRTQRLYKEFARSLLLADEVYLADIYPARERPIPGVSSQLIADQLQIEGRPVAAGPLPLARLAPRLRRELRPGDLFLTVGAGDVWKLGEQLVRPAKTARAGKKTRSK